MADYTPTGIFTGLDSDTLATLRSTALSRIATGDFTAMSGGGKSHSKSWSMSPQEILREVQYAESIASGGRVTRVVYDVRRRGASLYPAP